MRCPETKAGSRLIIGRLLLMAIASTLASTGVGVGLAVGEGLGLGLTLGLGLGLGLGDGETLGEGCRTLLVLVIWKIRRCA